MPRLATSAEILHLRRPLMVWSGALLAGLGDTFAGLGAGGSALAQAASDEGTSPPDDAPIMRPGQRVRRPGSRVQITTFNRSYSQPQREAVFTLEFIFVNESSREISIEMKNFVRLVADGLPRAPVEWSSNYVSVLTESAQDCTITFRVRGQPRVVHVQFGTGNDPARSYLRWPD